MATRAKVTIALMWPKMKTLKKQALRQQMQDAIKTIRKSKIGDQTGKAALYELPWYMVIGNPAAGKSSAVLHSASKFPFYGAR